MKLGRRRALRCWSHLEQEWCPACWGTWTLFSTFVFASLLSSMVGTGDRNWGGRAGVRLGLMEAMWKWKKEGRHAQEQSCSFTQNRSGDCVPVVQGPWRTYRVSQETPRMEDTICRSVPCSLKVVDVTQRHADLFIGSFQNLTTHGCYWQLSCLPEAFSSLTLHRGPQSHRMTLPCWGTAIPKEGSYSWFPVINGPCLETVK